MPDPLISSIAFLLGDRDGILTTAVDAAPLIEQADLPDRTVQMTVMCHQNHGDGDDWTVEFPCGWEGIAWVMVWDDTGEHLWHCPHGHENGWTSMNPVEKLEAAIAKLEAERAGTLYSEMNEWLVEVNPNAHKVPLGSPPEEFIPVTNDSLMVTLHRTIDPQLDWLRDQLARMHVDLNQQGIPLHYRFAIALAEAILGGDS